MLQWLRLSKKRPASMRPFPAFYGLLFLLVLVGVNACVQDSSNPSQEFDCEDFAYSDTLFYISATENRQISPVNVLGGVFSVSPEGLAIDPKSGVIDVNASETGLKYKISFTPEGESVSCEQFVTIGGVNYADRVYILNQNQIIASPIYNGVPGLPLPCEDDDDDDDDGDDDDSCEFDAENPSGQLLKDLGFEIDSKGNFDLQKTVENGTFGSTPINGQILDVELFYQLPDLSGSALNSLPMRFFYYETLADVPQELLDDIEEKNELINALRSGNSANFRTLSTTRPVGKPRPPFVVIVARFE